ncbi:amidohydrolase family protein [Planomonospora venezuelensis]|uniref:Cytosine/adenosine deaminase-related metal-dependent hydrolase n=1 Tax=Planomonospora venezuelensis TaxID=1999 RepID=A0A841DF07_PLAVE|nr:amidohydrolase family protein [Planomonospora venezuelensis]MBB5966665.1 cytosine/adenosine deaminase-related metal-dependent hydrolase [Planomonospora venezuelensis]GIN04318.1 hypothetical protein Pve01_59760 [Planomonospora venezuelensis]
MPMRAGPLSGAHALPAVTVHSAPLVLTVSGPPVADGALAVRSGRVVAVGPREEIEAAYPGSGPTRWPGMIVPGLVDAHVRLGRGLLSASAHGVTAAGGVAADLDAASLPGEAALAGVTYLETRCASEVLWEAGERDRLITAIREVDHPGIIGIAAHSPDPLVLEDLAILSRTFGLRLLVELGHRPAAPPDAGSPDEAFPGARPLSPAFLEEVGALGPGTHVALSAPLDEADRKLLRVRGTVAAVTSPFAAEGLLDGGNPVALGTRAGGDPLAAARRISRALPRDPGLDRLLIEALTLGGARALGLADGPGRLGRLEPGSRADFAVFAVEADAAAACTALLHAGPGRCLAAYTAGRPAWRRTAPRQTAGPADATATA